VRPDDRILRGVMSHEFITLFDVNYLPRGLALYRSLAATGADFRVRVVCMDTATEDVLTSLALPHLTPVALQELERHDAQLAAVKGDRTAVEYCWTATPAVCLFALETEPELSEITYLDADLMFFADPQPLFDELGDEAVLIVPHRYAAEHRHKQATSGIYNVEWLTFRRDPDGLEALHWWRNRCIEWCYARYEDGKMGDQKYLDDWPARFERVHVLEHPGGGLAPWNVTSHELTEVGGRPCVDGRPLVFYHHHSLRLYRPSAASRLAAAAGQLRRGVPPGPLYWSTNYPASPVERRLVWEPYLRELGEAFRMIDAQPGVEAYPVSQLTRKGLRLGRRVAGRLKRAVDPARRLPGATTRYRESWRSNEVARQMLELTDQQLQDTEIVAPYVAFRELLAPLASGSELPWPARILDIGAGAGAYGELLDRWWPGRFEYVGADYSEQILAAARKRWPGRRFVHADVLEPGALDGYDIVLASALLDVLAEIEQALDALLSADAKWIVLHRQRIDLDRSHVEVAPGYRGQHTYRSYVTPEQLERAAQRHGRTVSAAIDVDGDVRSFVLARS
jgi:hypothetical protein